MRERAAQGRLAAFVGLLPWQAEQLTGLELQRLARARRLDQGRQAELAAWLASVIIMGIRLAVKEGLGAKVSVLDWEHWKQTELIKTAPGRVRRSRRG